MSNDEQENNSSKSYDVFISFAVGDDKTGDKKAATMVCDYLESCGLKCWIYLRDRPLGIKFQEAIIDAIQNSKVLVLIYTAKTNESEYVEIEIRQAFKGKIPIIPFIMEDVPYNKVLDFYLASHNWQDATIPPIEFHLQKLAEDIIQIIKKEVNDSFSPNLKAIEQSKQQLPASIKNAIGMEFVLIPAGTFMMGSNNVYENEQPVHKVEIVKPFYLGKYPVTQEQWKAVIGNDFFSVMGKDPSFDKMDNKPVECISIDDIPLFIRKLNSMEGNEKYRLPSEAEWEYACRAGTTTKYFFGNDESKLNEYAFYNENSESKTQPVGWKKANPWGLYDMYGNVWEIVQDSWHGNYLGAPIDGSSWEKGGNLLFSVVRLLTTHRTRVCRGGGYDSNYNLCTSTCRICYECVDEKLGSYNCYKDMGLRVLREI